MTKGLYRLYARNVRLYYPYPVAYLGPCPPPPPTPPTPSDTLLKMGFQTYIFCSNVPSKCRKCRFRDPKFKIFPGGMPRTPLQLCRHYGLPLTKILATPLSISTVHAVHQPFCIKIKSSCRFFISKNKFFAQFAGMSVFDL